MQISKILKISSVIYWQKTVLKVHSICTGTVRIPHWLESAGLVRHLHLQLGHEVMLIHAKVMLIHVVHLELEW